MFKRVIYNGRRVPETGVKIAGALQLNGEIYKLPDEDFGPKEKESFLNMKVQ